MESMSQVQTHGSLFSGIGGFDLGFERVGFKSAWQVEIDPFCQEVLCARFPGVKRYGDIREVHGNLIEPVSVITFGSPCQDLSLSGKRSGLNGSESGLFFEAIRIIKEMRQSTNNAYPRFAVWENVTGALSSNSGRDFLSVLQAMENCGSVEIAWRIFNAQWFGVPQKRRRVFLVSDFTGECAGKVLFDEKADCGGGKEGTEVGDYDSTKPEPYFISSTLKRSGTGVLSPERTNQQIIIVPAVDKILGGSKGRVLELGKCTIIMQAPNPSGVRTNSGIPRRVDRPARSDTNRYHALGNAVAVPVVHWIANKMMKVLNQDG